MPRKQSKSRRRVPIVLGGGAMRGAALPGLLEFLEDNRVLTGDLYCVSIGSVVGTFYANGYSPEQISEAFEEEISFTRCIPIVPIIRALIPPLNPLRWLGLIDLVPFMRYLCEKYQLEPQNNLHILTYDTTNQQAVVFEGGDYDLPIAMAASCSVPGIFRPVTACVYGHYRVFVDYGVVHPHPTAFCEGPSIVAKLFHSGPIDAIWPDDPKHFAVNAGDVKMAPFVRLSHQRCVESFEHGYNMAAQALSEPIRLGKIPTRRRRSRKSA